MGGRRRYSPGHHRSDVHLAEPFLGHGWGSCGSEWWASLREVIALSRREGGESGFKLVNGKGELKDGNVGSRKQGAGSRR